MFVTNRYMRNRQVQHSLDKQQSGMKPNGQLWSSFSQLMVEKDYNLNLKTVL
jgi:hypothetical protein